MTHYTYFKTPSGAVHRTSVGDVWINCVELSQKEGLAAWRADAIKDLRKMLKPGATVYTVLRHVSASGMSRSISLVIPSKDHNGKPCITDITWLCAQSNGSIIDERHSGIKIGGCGMDMGFQLVYNLGLRLWPKGTRKPHGTRNGQPDTNGGYALRHAWL